MIVHFSIKVGHDAEWRYTIGNITPERRDDQVNYYSVVRALVGADWDTMAMVTHVPEEGASWLVKKALDALPILPREADVTARSGT